MRACFSLVLAASAGLVLSVGSAMAADGPKPGLWEMKASVPGMPQAQTTKVCVGESAPGSNPFAPPPTPGASCAKNNVTKTSSGYTFDTECQAQGMTVSTKGEVTGDFQQSYKTTMTTKMSGANLPAAMAKEMKSTVDAKYVGACPAGMAPGQAQPG